MKRREARAVMVQLPVAAGVRNAIRSLCHSSHWTVQSAESAIRGTTVSSPPPLYEEVPPDFWGVLCSDLKKESGGGGVTNFFQCKHRGAQEDRLDIWKEEAGGGEAELHARFLA